MAKINNPLMIIKKTTGGDAEYIKFIERSSTEITVPEGATKIGAYSFYNYNDSYLGSGNGIKNVVLPNSVNTIEKNAFYQCSQLETINFSNNITEIKDNAFVNCSKLNVEHLPNSLKKLGQSAFQQCINLELLDLPNGLENIQNWCFGGCTKLKLTSLPDSLTYIAGSAFENCSNINIHYFKLAGNGSMFKNCIGITGKITIAEIGSNTDIGSNCFEGCTGITEVEYLGSCRNYSLSRTYELWSNAFLNCSSLTKMSFPNATYVMTLRNVNAFPNGADWAGTIEVPSALLETWKASTNWSSLTNVTWVGI